MLSIKNRSQTLFVPAVVAMLAASMVCGCAQQQPKPSELQALEKTLSAEGANKVKEAPGAAKYYQKARDLRGLADEKYEEGELDRAEQYAIRGNIAYETAKVIAEQYDVYQRVKNLGAKVSELNPKIRTLRDERNTLQNEVRQLQQTLRAQREQQSAKQRREAMANNQSNDGISDAKREEAKNALERAREARRNALEVKADDFAEGTFNRASNQLKSAENIMSSSPDSVDNIVATAKEAGEYFDKAAEEARPEYKEEKAKQNPQQRLASLKSKAIDTFGAAQVKDAPRGLRVIVPGSFPKGDSTLTSSGRTQIEQAAKLADTFDEFQLTIEGYTRKGDPTANLAISKNRARNARDLMKAQGLSTGRMSTSGNGQDRIRFPQQAGQNDRIEIIYRLPPESFYER
jgi:outer membrane protein OmpA-like peptidoglycan-associated protein